MGYIYLVTNTKNNKQYIGQSVCADINNRWRQHKAKDSIGKYLLSAYNKYGIEKFTYKIICICFDEDCNKYEEEYIKKYNTLAPNGYNLREGGHNTKHNPETLKLISEKLKGRKLSKAQIEKMRINMTGRKHSEETRKKLSESSKGVKNANYGKIYTDEEKAKLSINIKKGLENKKQNGGIINKNSLNNIIVANKKRCKKVTQYSIDGILINTYNSITEASKLNKITQESISKSCHDINSMKTAAGFIWKFI